MALAQADVLFDVEYLDGPDCPVCKQKILYIAQVRISDASVRTTGGDVFGSDMTADITSKVESLRVEHTCTPRKKDG